MSGLKYDIFQSGSAISSSWQAGRYLIITPMTMLVAFSRAAGAGRISLHFGAVPPIATRAEHGCKQCLDDPWPSQVQPIEGFACRLSHYVQHASSVTDRVYPIATQILLG